MLSLELEKTPELKLSLVASILVLLLNAYQKVISPLLHAFGPSCRFHPTCSEYARQTIIKDGAVFGFLRALRRVSKCHPFHPGGFDPP